MSSTKDNPKKTNKNQEFISVFGAREHNLKNLTLQIPRNQLVVFTGLSGSGKSSLAFDTIYAEGQRRYVESLSSYARQFLGVMDKPDVDQIDGLSPAISIDQKSTSRNPRSTVGTITEVYDYLRLLFARVGHPHCPVCGREVKHQSAAQIVEEIQKLGDIKAKPPIRVLVLAPIVRDRKGEFSQLFTDLRKRGITRVRVDGQIHDIEDEFTLIKTNKHSIDAVVDRLVLPVADKQRLSESVETALKLAEGNLIIAKIQDVSFEIPDFPTELEDHLFSEKFACPFDNISLPEIEPRTFSFNSPHGACPTCTGIGTKLEVEPELVFNPNLTIAQGGILPWSRLSTHETWFSRLLEEASKQIHFSINTPIKDLTDADRKFLLYGSEKVFKVQGENRFGKSAEWQTTFEGVIPNLERRHRETESGYIRGEIEKFMRILTCPTCNGTRLKPEALSVTVDGLNIEQVSKKSIRNSLEWVKSIKTSFAGNARDNQVSEPILKEITARLQFLIDVGLDYLSLSRTATTLAGGEAQRIRLASQIGSGLSGVLYVLDEPSIGLHQRDNVRLIGTLQKLRDLGNSVLVVEHDRDMMLESDYIFDFGPGAGEHGGAIVSQGTPQEIIKDSKSLTGKYLSDKKKITTKSGSFINPHEGKELTIIGATEHNLKGIDVTIPLGKFVCFTGVSGSGKSTLVHDILYKSLAQQFYHAKERPGSHTTIMGTESLDKVIMIDQSPIGRTPRSNPATYTGIFTPIRELFASTTEAKIRGYKSGRFSFNVKGGRCEACEGEGQVKIEMQFLPDVYVDCEVCTGKRYNDEALEVHFKDKNIFEVLDMTVEEALEFFSNIPSIKNKLATVVDVGLGYIKLGQPAPTLSGGEAQRVKLASELSKRSTGKTLYILDEPTTGLHFADIEKLLNILMRLVEQGNTIVVIEHNLDVIKNADWIIDLGPEGGDGGGTVVAQGTPSEVSKKSKSHTAKFLSKLI